MHSHEIIHFVRQHPSLKTTKILVLTAQPLSAGQLAEGADGYLTKPVEPYELLAKVAALVGKH
jgi:CheY-like chemotaxis protein